MSLCHRIGVGALALGLATLASAAIPAAELETPGRVRLVLQQSAQQKAPALSMHFSGYHDTRCPSDVQCAWAGEARAFFWVSGAGIQPQVLVLPWDGSGQPSRVTQRLGPFRFTLVSLEPRPLMNGTVNPADVTAVLEVVAEPAPPAR
jgi:hypothetical protein